MNSLKTGIGRASLLIQWLVAAFLGGSAALVNAATASSQFNVTATMHSPSSPNLPKSAFCRYTPAVAFGALVTVVCATGEVVDITAPARIASWIPVHGGAYRFILPPSYAAGLPDFYDGYIAHGTVASWRIVQLADRNYYELLVGW